MKKRPIPSCFIQQTMEAIGGKWRILTIRALSHGNTSFGTLKRAIPSITERMLAAQLRELQQDGLIVRSVLSAKPLRVSYACTPLGETLVPLASALYDWGISHGTSFLANRIESIEHAPVMTPKSGGVSNGGACGHGAATIAAGERAG